MWRVSYYLDFQAALELWGIHIAGTGMCSVQMVGWVMYFWITISRLQHVCIYLFFYLRAGIVQSCDSCLFDSWDSFLCSEGTTALSWLLTSIGCYVAWNCTSTPSSLLGMLLNYTQRVLNCYSFIGFYFMIHHFAQWMIWIKLLFGILLLSAAGLFIDFDM
jgi:hypothetical protein